MTIVSFGWTRVFSGTRGAREGAVRLRVVGTQLGTAMSTEGHIRGIAVEAIRTSTDGAAVELILDVASIGSQSNAVARWFPTVGTVLG